MAKVLRKIVKANENERFLFNVVGRQLSKQSCAGDSCKYDIVVVGGGIVGCATARELKTRHSQLSMAIVEKEKDLAMHQSGHNSGVVHAGIYYKPGSLKAKLCVEGLHLSYEYFNKRKFPYKKVGKLIVATDEVEVKRLHDLLDRGTKNNVPDLKLLKGVKEIQKIEPNCVGLEAIWSPHTGIVDWGKVTKEFGKDFKEMGGEIHLNYQVSNFVDSRNADYPVRVSAKRGDSVLAKYVLTCGGLQSDLLAVMSGCPKTPRIVPFRGEYLLLDPRKAHIVKGNIYPVPDPRFPFLGVHFTPRMDGSVWLGPNAVLSFKREGYKWTDISLSELAEVLTYPGFLKLAGKHVLAGTKEVIKSLYPPLQVKDLQKFIPTITNQDVMPGPAGVRAQALDDDGNLVDDFYFDISRKTSSDAISSRILHCRNAPSPAATSSMAIAKMVADKLEQEFGIKK